jgi:hypothetical protein
MEDGCWMMINWLGVDGPDTALTVTVLEVAVKEPALVVNPMDIVSAVL